MPMNEALITPGPLLSLAYTRWELLGPIPMPHRMHSYRAVSSDNTVHLWALAAPSGTVSYRLHSDFPEHWFLSATCPNDDAITAAAFAAARTSTYGIATDGTGTHRTVTEALLEAGWSAEMLYHRGTVAELVFASPGGGTLARLLTGSTDHGSQPHWQITDSHTDGPAIADLITPGPVLVAYLLTAAA